MLAPQTSPPGGFPAPQQTAQQKEPWLYHGEISNTQRPNDYLAPAHQGAADIMANTGLGLPVPGAPRYLMNALAERPALSAGVLGAGALFAGSSDAGSPQLTKSQQRQMDMERQRNQMDSDSALARIRAETDAANSRGASDAATKAKAAKDASAQAEYDASVGRAESARAFELSRDRRFSGTGMGQLMNDLGGAAPVVAGAVAGGVGRAVAGPARSVAGDVVKNYLAPAVEGGVGGFTAANLPMLYNWLYTEPDNPEKKADMAYSRELPPGHPRKQEFLDYAKALPDKNPVHEQGRDEFYDGMGERALASGIEGSGAGIFGANVARGVGIGAQGAYNGVRNALSPRAAGPAGPAGPPVNALGSAAWGPNHPSYRPRGPSGRFTAP